MSEYPTNEPIDEVEPVMAEAMEDTAVSPSEPETTNQLEERPSRRWWMVGGGIVLLLVVALIALVLSAQSKENAQWLQAQVAAEEGAWAFAEQSLDAQLALQPAFALRRAAEAQGLRGIARYEQGNLAGALADLNEALAQDANLMDVYAYRALTQIETDKEAARADAQTAVNSGLLSDYLQAQMQMILAGSGDADIIAAALSSPEYLTDAQVAELTLAQIAEIEEPDQIVAATTAVLGREFTLQPAQIAGLAYAAAIAHQALGETDAAFLQAEKALAQEDGLIDSERAALYLLRAEWYEAHGELATAVAEAQAAADLDDTVTLHLALQAWQAYRDFDLATAKASAEALLETATADTLSSQIAHRTLGGVATLQDTPRLALAALDSALAVNPNDVEARALRVHNLLRVSEWDAAAADVNILAETAPSAPASLWAQAAVAMTNGDGELAHVLLDQAIAQDEAHPEYYTLRATTFRLTQDRNLALADLEAALALYPDYLFGLESRQYLLVDQYQTQELEEAARQLIDMYPDSPVGYYLLGAYYLDEAGDKEAALAQAEEVIARNPENARGYLLRGRIHFQMREFAAAQADYEQALALDPDSPSARSGLAEIARQQDNLDTAVSLAEENVELYPRSLSTRVELASAYMDQQENEKAWALLHEVLAEDPQYEQAIGMRAYLYAYQGELEQALREMEKIISLYPDNPYAYTAKAGFQFDLGRLDEAVESAEKAIGLNPLLAAPHRLLFAMAVENNDLDEANQQLDLWLEKASVYDEDPELLSNMQLISGRFEDVITTTTTALAEEPDAGDLYYFNRALAHLNLGHIEEGQADLEESLAVSENVTLIADVETVMAESRQVVSIADGRLQYTNETFGYTLNYADWWVRQPGDPEQNLDLLLVHETEEEFGAAYTNLFIEDIEVSAQMIAEIVKNDAARQSNFTLISANASPLNAGNSYVIRYELASAELIQGKQYIFTQGNKIILLTLEAFDSTFAELEAELDAIAASFEFLP